MISYPRITLLSALLVLPVSIKSAANQPQPININSYDLQLAEPVNPDAYSCWQSVIYALQALASMAFMADSGLLITDMSVGLNGTQNVTMTALSSTGLVEVSMANYIMATLGFIRWYKGMPPPPGGRSYHFISTAGGASGLMIVCSGLITENPWTIRAGNLIATVFFSAQGITTKWRAPGLHPLTKWQIIGSNIGGMLFAASSFIPQDHTMAFQATLVSGILTISASTIPVLIKFLLDTIRCR